MDIPREGILCDILWSDPEDRNGWGYSPRGAGFVWGYDCSEKFLYINKIKFISRAHQLIMKGYNWCHNNKVLSIFSAPNYCYRCGNEAAVMNVENENNIEFYTYNSAPKECYKKIEDEEEKNNNNEKNNKEFDSDSDNESDDDSYSEYFHIKYAMRYFV